MTKPHPLYAVWRTMINRCHNPKNKGYRFYGARGIRVCERWQILENFVADIGERPFYGATIDRKDTFGNYCPENFRWATQKEQTRNMRSNKPVTFNGKTRCIGEWGEIIGISGHTLRARMKRGMTKEAALTKPKRSYPMIQISGQSKTVHQWITESGAPYGTIYGRIKRGWTPEKAITTPIRIGNYVRH